MMSRYLLHMLMLEDCAEWSLLLMLFLLKTKQLVNFASARSDLWDRFVKDFEDRGKYERWRY